MLKNFTHVDIIYEKERKKEIKEEISVSES